MKGKKRQQQQHCKEEDYVNFFFNFNFNFAKNDLMFFQQGYMMFKNYDFA